MPKRRASSPIVIDSDSESDHENGESQSFPRRLLPQHVVHPLLWRRVCRWYAAGAPVIMLQLQLLYHIHVSALFSLSYAELDMLELFSGDGNMFKSFEHFLYASYGFEKNDLYLRDYLTHFGFAFACTLLYRLKPISITTSAPVCSSWTYMARSKTHRCEALPLGNPLFINVYHSNVMVARLVLQLMFLSARGIMWVVEQPQPSVIFKHPRFQQFLGWTQVYTFTLDLRRLGAPTKKPTTLYSNFPEISHLTEYKGAPNL